jgi:hypothetical protein
MKNGMSIKKNVPHGTLRLVKMLKSILERTDGSLRSGLKKRKNDGRLCCSDNSKGLYHYCIVNGYS